MAAAGHPSYRVSRIALPQEVTTMLRLWTAIQARLAEEDGASLVEYALLVALIAIVAIAAIVLLGNRVTTTLSNAATSL
jgi:Flp pilus assembly protein, pilin Flp